MSVALGVLAAAAALAPLPPLPAQGLALETRAGAELETLAGRRITVIPRLSLATDKKNGPRLTMRDGSGRLYVLDPAARRIRRVSEPPVQNGCRTTDVRLFICAGTIKSGDHVIARAPAKVGHWEWAGRSRRSGAVLAQWSAECEVPVAYLISGGRLRALGDETTALGWLSSGEALVHFELGVCGAQARSGVYVVPLAGRPRLVLRTKRFSQYAMWGG